MAYFSAASPRIAGVPLAGTYLSFFLQNDSGSSVIVKPKRGVFQRDSGGVVYTSVMPSIKAYRGTAQVVDAAVLMDKCAFDTSATASNAFVKARCAYSPDLSNTVSLDGTPAGGMLRRAYGPRQHTLAEAWSSDDGEIMPELFKSKEFFIYPGQAYIVQIDNLNTSSDPVQAAWFYQVLWEEVALSTYAISGNVTNGGTGVVGAEVTVLVADDTSMTNAYLQGIYTTTSGGAWSANIPVGKLAYVYANDYSGGVYYTAPGAPYIS